MTTLTSDQERAQRLEQLDAMVNLRRKIKRGETLYRSGETFDSIYAIRSGFFKSRVTYEDGRDQVIGFSMGGEILGMDGIGQGRHGGMEEGGIADCRNYGSFYSGINIALCQTDTCTHGYFIPNGIKRRIHSQNCAPNIACYHNIFLFQMQFTNRTVNRHICPTMRAT